jgi:predicted nucleic acid-binding protein
MLIIDTNILYYATGLSEHHSIASSTINKAIATFDNVAVSSISLAEFITKYHKRAGTIRRVCSFMRQNHIGIACSS